MDHTISIRDGRDLADNEEPRFSVESPDIDVPPTLRQGSFSTVRHMNRTRTRNDASKHSRRQNTPREGYVDPGTAFAPDPVKYHTHVQRVAGGELVNRLR